MTYRQPSLHDAEQDSTPLRHFAFYGTAAKRMKRRAFWLGWLAGSLFMGVGFLAGAAFAEPSHDWGGSSATLSHGTGDAVAEVECVNRITSGPSLLSFTLTLDGFEVAVIVEQGDGDIPDRYTVTPPPGYVAIPPSVTVAEHDSATILIFLSDGGMS